MTFHQGLKGKGKEKGAGEEQKEEMRVQSLRVHVFENNEHLVEADVHQKEERKDCDEEKTEANEIKAMEIGEENADVLEYWRDNFCHEEEGGLDEVASLSSSSLLSQDVLT